MIKRDLEEIKEDFENVKNSDMPNNLKNSSYVKFMNELEHNYGSLVYNPLEDDLKRSDVVLYKSISDSRIFD